MTAQCALYMGALKMIVCIGRFRGGPSRLRPLPFGDGPTPSLYSWVISDNGTVLWRHALQNIQNDCHQWLSHSFIKHTNLFSAGAPPRIPLGNLQRFPRPSIAGLSWFSHSFRVYQIRFRPGSVQTWRGELTSLPRPPSRFKMTYF